MPQSLAKVTLHLVFSTKNRVPFFRDPELRRQLFAYMSTILREKVDSPALLINGVEDHLHALISLSRKVAIMEVVQKTKTETTKWLKKQAPELREFAWQAGYGVFSVSESKLTEVIRYVENQERHHRVMTFQEEYRKLCDRHGVELDERYAWE